MSSNGGNGQDMIMQDDLVWMMGARLALLRRCRDPCPAPVGQYRTVPQYYFTNKSMIDLPRQSSNPDKCTLALASVCNQGLDASDPPRCKIPMRSWRSMTDEKRLGAARVH